MSRIFVERCGNDLPSGVAGRDDDTAVVDVADVLALEANLSTLVYGGVTTAIQLTGSEWPDETSNRRVREGRWRWQ